MIQRQRSNDGRLLITCYRTAIGLDLVQLGRRLEHIGDQITVRQFSRFCNSRRPTRVLQNDRIVRIPHVVCFEFLARPPLWEDK